MSSPAASAKGKEKAKPAFKSKWINVLGWLVYNKQIVLVLKFQSVCAPVTQVSKKNSLSSTIIINCVALRTHSSMSLLLCDARIDIPTIARRGLTRPLIFEPGFACAAAIVQVSKKNSYSNNCSIALTSLPPSPLYARIDLLTIARRTLRANKDFGTGFASGQHGGGRCVASAGALFFLPFCVC
jgi:hypothetical protein